MADIGNLLSQNQQLHEEINRRIHQLSAISTVATAVGHSLDLDITLNTALEAVVAVLEADAAGISLIDEEAQEVVLRAQLGWVHDFVKRNPMRIPLGKGMSGQVITHDTLVVHNDLDGSEEFAVPSFKRETFRSIVMAPMHARGQIIGILSIMSYTPNRFDDDSLAVLRSVADTVGVALANARLHETHVEQEERLKAILHSTADGIIATDQNGRISLCNSAAAGMLDVQADSLIGIPLREAAIQVHIRDRLLKTLSEEPAESITDAFQVSLENGKTFSISVSPVHIARQLTDDEVTDGWVIVLQDITHMREAEIARVQFIQAAAHDMKNPLGVTQSSLHMLESMIDHKDKEIIEVFGIARDGIRRLQRLIDDLLQIEKIESGYGFRLDEVDIREMCYELGLQISPVIADHHLGFELTIAEELPRIILIDRDWMTRALQNYLENAAKYTQSGGHVLFRVLMEEDNIVFEVVDNGPGIPLRAQSQIFDRFYRLDEHRDIHGTGLGLAIVKSVAEAHGGYAYVRSQINNGSTFGISIPNTGNRIHSD